MATSTFLVVLCFTGCGLVMSGPLLREKRQTDPCDEHLPNICTEVSPTHVLKIPHPTDNRKFLQCGNNRRMFVIQCPSGEVYDATASDCVVQTGQQPQVTQAPPSSSGLPYPRNLCTQANIDNGYIFYPNHNDNTKFYECARAGFVVALSCPTHLVFNADQQKCGVPTGTVQGSSAPGGILTAAVGSNPCTPGAILSNHLFFAHPDPTMYYQCDLGGNAHLMNCPHGLIWNEAKEQCDSRFSSLFG